MTWQERTSNIISTTGTNLVVVKEETVKDEFDKLGLKLRSHESDRSVDCHAAARDGRNKADTINMHGGIGSDVSTKSITAGAA